MSDDLAEGLRLEVVEVDAAGLSDAELKRLAGFLDYGAASSEHWPDATRLFLLDVAGQLRDVASWRAMVLERHEVELAGRDWI